MSLRDAFLDIRKMKRSLSLREDLEPEQIVATLDHILREAVAVQSTGNQRFQKNAANELKNIRNDLLAGQVKAGARTPEYVTKYSLILDNLEADMQQRFDREESIFSGAVDSIKSSVPSADSIVSAMIVANPIFGYSAKIVLDMIKGNKERKRKAEAEHRHRMKLVKDQQAIIDEQKGTEQLHEENIKEETKKVQGKAERKRAYQEDFQRIDDKLGSLYDLLNRSAFVNGPDRNDERVINMVQDQDSVFKLLPSPDSESVDVERVIVEESDDTIDAIRISGDQTTDAIDRLVDIEAERLRLEQQGRLDAANRDAELARINHGEGAGNTQAEKDPNSFWKTLLALPGLLLGGGMAALSKLLPTGFVKDAQGVLKTFGRIGGMVKVLGKFTGVLTVLTSLYDGLDGFFSGVHKAFGDEVTMRERLETATSYLITGLLQPIDWIVKFFGGEGFGNIEEFRTRFARKIDSLVTQIIDKSAKLFEIVSDSFDEIIDGTNNWFKSNFSWLPGVDAPKPEEIVHNNYTEEREYIDNSGNVVYGSPKYDKPVLADPNDNPMLYDKPVLLDGDDSDRLQRRNVEKQKNTPSNQLSDTIDRSTSQSNNKNVNSVINAPSTTNVSNSNNYLESKNSRNDDPSYRRIADRWNSSSMMGM